MYLKVAEAVLFHVFPAIADCQSHAQMTEPGLGTRQWHRSIETGHTHSTGSVCLVPRRWSGTTARCQMSVAKCS